MPTQLSLTKDPFDPYGNEIARRHEERDFEANGVGHFRIEQVNFSNHQSFQFFGIGWMMIFDIHIQE